MSKFMHGLEIFGTCLSVVASACQNGRTIIDGFCGLKEDCQLAHEFINSLRQKGSPMMIEEINC